MSACLIGHDWQNGLACHDCGAARTPEEAIVSGLASRRGGDGASARDLLDAYRVQVLAEAASTAACLPDRQARLLDAIRTHGGPWNTVRVLDLYRLTDPTVVQRGTARRDLEQLHRAGHLVLVDAPNNRHYTLNRKASAQ